MAFELTTTAQLLSEQTRIGQQLILEIEGIDLIFGAVTVTKLAKYGDDIVFGQPGLVYGGVIEDPNGRDWIQLKGTTNNIKQQISQDKASASSVQRIAVNLLDKDEKLSELFQPGNVISDLLGRKASFYLAFQGGAHPEDSVRIMSGVIDQQEFGAGSCKVGIANPSTLQRTTLFQKATDTVGAAIDNSQTTITLNSTEGFLLPEDVIRTYARINDEIIEYTGISGNDLTGCVRGSQNTVANAHEIDDDVESHYQITGDPITLALKLMMSGGEEFYATENATNFVQVDVLNNIADTFIISDKNFESSSGIVEGDLVTITGSDGGLNDVVDLPVSSISTLASGTIITVLGANFVSEVGSSASANFKSQYRAFIQDGVGCGMTPDQVDVAQHEYVFGLFSSAFPDYDFLLKDEINAKDFLDKELLFPSGLYSIPRKGRASLNITIPPLADNTTKVLDETTVKKPETITIKRSTSKYFYNSVIYKMNEDSLDDKFLKNTLTLSQKSINRIPITNKPLVIESKGLRDNAVTDNFVEIQTRRFLDRYQFGAESVDVEVLYKTGFNIEVGDSVIFGSPALHVSDSTTGNRQFQKRIFEVINKQLDIKQGRIRLSLLDTSFGLDGRFGVISPSSLTGPGSTTSELVLKTSFGTEATELEKDKWEQYIGETIVVHNDDWTFQEETTIEGFDPTNPSMMLIDPPLSISVSEDYTIEAPYYPNNTDSNDGFTWKNLHVAMNPTVAVVSGANNFTFDVAPADVSKFTVGQSVRVHDENFTNDSTPSLDIDDAEVTDITVNTITVDRDLGFTPSSLMEVELIGYIDGGVPYRYI